MSKTLIFVFKSSFIRKTAVCLLLAYIVDLVLKGFNMLSDYSDFRITDYIPDLVSEALLLILIFGGFVVFLFTADKKAAVLAYTKFLIGSFCFYAVIMYRLSWWDLSYAYPTLVLNGTLIQELSISGSKLLITFLGIVFLGVVYVDAVHNKLSAVEFPFLVGLLLWLFLFSLHCFNLLLLFLLMEAITLLVVVSNTIYFVFVGTKLIKPIIQFFVLNLVISTLYLVGVALVLFLVPEQGAYTLSYASFWQIFETLANTVLDLSSTLVYFKLTMILMLVPLLFKLTLAPFSIWVTNIYAYLPTLFLLLIMTIYKVVYALLFLRLFVNIIDLIPTLREFWQNSVIVFVVPSMFVGCFAYRAQDIKTVLAYTTVSQFGYIIAGFIVSSPEAMKYALIYMVVYSLQLFSIFIIFLILQAKYDFTNLNQLFLIKKYNKFYYYLLFIIFFSLSGIPPLSGFFTKYFLFLHLYKAGFFMVALTGLVTGFIMAVIYLQIVLQLMTVKPAHTAVLKYEQTKKFALTGSLSFTYNRFVIGLNIFLGLVLVLNIFFFFFLPELSTIAGAYIYKLVYANVCYSR